MLRKIITIDEEICNGCGDCVPECMEGALQIIEGKARLISDLFCDGLGACIGHCPLDAIKIEERQAEEYNEILVMEKLVKGPVSVMEAHLKHLIDHNAQEQYDKAVTYMKEKNIKNPIKPKPTNGTHQIEIPCGCPGSAMLDMRNTAVDNQLETKIELKSELTQWPIQLHLVNPQAPYFRGRELVIMADCVPFTMADAHRKYIKDRSIVIACPKLDYTGPYVEKLTEIFSMARPSKVIILIMEVPCCSGLSKFASTAAGLSGRKDLVVEEHILGINGQIKEKSIVFDYEMSEN
ncbi:MAG: fdx [Ignavibacteria bacterium]|nr:fdx [Ignavibacteria bacterium]